MAFVCFVESILYDFWIAAEMVIQASEPIASCTNFFNLTAMLISTLFPEGPLLASSSFYTNAAYHVLSLLSKKSFAALFTDKSSG